MMIYPSAHCFLFFNMYNKVWSIGLSKHEKMIKYHVHIRSKDQFKQVGVREKNDRNEIKSLEY